jgi:hypothetical protein
MASLCIYLRLDTEEVIAYILVKVFRIRDQRSFLCWKLLQASSHFAASQATKQIGRREIPSYAIVPFALLKLLLGVNLIEPGKPSARIALSFCRFVIKYFHTTQFAEFSPVYFKRKSPLSRARAE